MLKWVFTVGAALLILGVAMAMGHAFGGRRDGFDETRFEPVRAVVSERAKVWCHDVVHTVCEDVQCRPALPSDGPRDWWVCNVWYVEASESFYKERLRCSETTRRCFAEERYRGTD